MKKLLPLFAFATTACGGPEVINQDLRRIPGLTLSVTIQDPEFTASPSELVSLRYDRATPESPCYRIPAATHLTVNGATIPLRVRGDSRLSFDGAFSCEQPWFSGTPPPMGEARIEYLLTDGHSRMRAVFQELHAKRRIRVNAQEQATLRVGETVDVEWLPGTDQFSDALEIVLTQVGSNDTGYTLETYQLEEGNHIRFTLPPMKAGQYHLRVYGEGHAGVEACEEGRIRCRNEFFDTGHLRRAGAGGRATALGHTPALASLR